MIALCILVAAILCGLYALFFTPRGAALMENPHQAGADARQWVSRHRVQAPLVYIGLFAVATLLALPVWWLQILSGYGFGLYLGVVYSQLGAVAGATLTVMMSHWLGAEFFQSRVESKMQKLRQLGEILGHNGLLVVMAARLIHVVPFALSNYFFGITRITLAEVAIGTFLGGIPATAFYVAAGAGYHPWSNGKFILVVAVLNLFLLIPLIVRYLRPDWFRKIHVE